MIHRHYCGCGASWRCGNEGCTEEDMCRDCAAFEEGSPDCTREDIEFSLGREEE